MPTRKIRNGVRVVRYILYKETLVDGWELAWSFLGSFAGIGVIALLQFYTLAESDQLLLIGSFGASSVLVYGSIQSPLAQPRNLIGGHVVSALIGVSVQMLVPDFMILAAPLAVSFSIVAMLYTKTLHPPGGATALIAVIGSEGIKSLGYMYVLYPVLSGAFILFLVALLFNNMSPNRRYPTSSRFTRIVKKIITRN